MYQVYKRSNVFYFIALQVTYEVPADVGGKLFCFLYKFLDIVFSKKEPSGETIFYLIVKNYTRIRRRVKTKKRTAPNGGRAPACSDWSGEHPARPSSPSRQAAFRRAERLRFYARRKDQKQSLPLGPGHEEHQDLTRRG